MARFTAKTVSVDVEVWKPYQEDKLVPKDLEFTMRELADAEHEVSQVQNMQHHLISKERIHRNVAEGTNSQVLFWSIMEMVVLGLAIFGQIFWLRRIVNNSQKSHFF
mmetsp:Transcript_8093/g.8964  ORF Transcript_8093/g.8964 Transcript_8093/m.8964 type:complete len:107 (-) Transcript_8093:127-447(-)